MFAPTSAPPLAGWRLTDEQREAATFDGGHLLIVAGAGTGKTTGLTARLAHLVARGVDPGRILLLTFSRRAAADLLQRAEATTGQGVARQTWGGTFHAVANRLLRRHGRALGLDPSFTVLDQGDAAGLLALVREELLDGDPTQAPAPVDTARRRRVKPETMAAILSRVVNSSTPVSEAVARHFPWCAADVGVLKATFAAYTARKRAAQLLDFDDLLLCWQALFETPVVGDELRGRFDHVLVDEYQDTNALQADLLAQLAGGGARITAVGDDAQAIYGFRAADVRNILDFPSRFGADVVRLEQSQRSTPPLVAFTNAVIAEAAERHEKQLWSARTGGTRPALVTCADEGAQSAAVCERLLDHLEKGVPLRSQAVLVRTGHHSDLLELELTVRHIPYVKYGGLRFLEAAHVKDLVAVLRLVENPRDEVAWARVLQLIEGVGPATARRLLAAAGAAGGDARLVLLERPPPMPPAVAAAVRDLATSLVEASSPHLVVAAQVERVRCWLDPVVAARHGDAAARLADLDRLGNAAAASPSLGRFLVELALDPPASTGDLAGPPLLDDDVLTISTIHSAKGLEWDVVHVLHLADGCIPSDMATGNTDEIEEERRLLYVGLTRARNALYGYVPLRYHHHRRGRDDAHGYAQRSRFLTPAVLEHVDHQGAAPVGDVDGVDGRPPTGSGLGPVDRRLATLFEGQAGPQMAGQAASPTAEEPPTMALIPAGPCRRLCGAVVGALTLVALTVAPAGAQTPTVAIRGMAFEPANVQVQLVAGEPNFPAAHGHAVWTNEDQAEHTVTFDDPRVVSSGRIATSQRFEAVLTLAGSFTYRCVIHPAMTGRVEVAPVAGTETKETRAAGDADEGSGRSVTLVLVGAALAVAAAVLAWFLVRRRRTAQGGSVEP